MSAIADPKSPGAIPPVIEEPTYYGFRMVRRTLPDGREVHEQVDLTREDVLHPQEGDAIMQGEPHDDDRIYLKNVFQRATVDNPAAKVFADLGVDLDIPGRAPFCPDITVLFGVQEDRLWSMYYVAEFRVVPWLLVEIVSASTRSIDLVDKVRYYHLGHVPLYIIADSVIRGRDRNLRLIGYRDTPEGYVEWLPDARGWFWLDRLGLYLGVADERLVCYDAQGMEIADYVHLSQAAAAAETRAAEEAQGRMVAETRLVQETQARAAAEMRATLEAEARVAAEQRVRELEEMYRHLQTDEPKDQP